MKYGIQFVNTDGETEYVSSTRAGCELSRDITDLALFSQRQSAEDAVKAIRKDGDEPKNGDLMVIRVDFTVNEVIPVERPKKKIGWIIKGPGSYYGDYYAGAKNKTPNEQYRKFGNLERATVFETREKAQKVLDNIIREAQSWVKFMGDPQRYFFTNLPPSTPKEKAQKAMDDHTKWWLKPLLEAEILEILEHR